MVLLVFMMEYSVIVFGFMAQTFLLIRVTNICSVLMSINCSNYTYIMLLENMSECKGKTWNSSTVEYTMISVTPTSICILLQLSLEKIIFLFIELLHCISYYSCHRFSEKCKSCGGTIHNYGLLVFCCSRTPAQRDKYSFRGSSAN